MPGATALTMTGGSGGGGPGNPQALNRYTYVFNNPVLHTDPTGHCPWCVIGAIGGALVGAGIAYGAQVYNNYQSGMDIQQAMTTNINGAAIVTGAVAGAVVGGTMGFAATAGVAGVTVGTATQMGAIGAGSNMAGNVAGQLLAPGGSIQNINPTDVAVAGVVGFTAGALEPIGATTLAGSVALGGVANSAQYAATQSIKGDQVIATGLLTNAITGAIGGGTSGAISPVKGLRYSKQGYADDFMAANVGISSLSRSLLASTVSNGSYNPSGAR